MIWIKTIGVNITHITNKTTVYALLNDVKVGVIIPSWGRIVSFNV